MAPQYFLYWIYLNLWLIYHLWNSDKQLMNQPVCYQQTVMSSLSSWFGVTPNRFQLNCTEWIKCCPKALLKCYSSSCLPSLIHSWTLGKAFLCCLLFLCFFLKRKSQKLRGKKKKSGNSITPFLAEVEDICTLWSSCATLPTQMQVSGVELLQPVY